MNLFKLGQLLSVRCRQKMSKHVPMACFFSVRVSHVAMQGKNDVKCINKWSAKSLEIKLQQSWPLVIKKTKVWQIIELKAYSLLLLEWLVVKESSDKIIHENCFWSDISLFLLITPREFRGHCRGDRKPSARRILVRYRWPHWVIKYWNLLTKGLI